ncbi:MAG: SDR family oxidoreductase [Rickettsiales bacterium]|jgi:NAD(P)-dependent dehydrogenase (short-subunit alcohol dehydrogenase family)|nr:SDR family oxidoreductase [Rickettsiales bacterium]
MTNELQKNVLITGAAVRIGKYIAEKLAYDGWSIALHYNNSEQEAYDLAHSLLPITNVMLFKANLADKEDSAQLIDNVNKQLGPVNLLINNASICVNDNLDNLNSSTLENHFAIHVNNIVYLSKCMAKQEGAKDIINIIDSDISRNIKKFFSYNLSKKTLFDLTKMLAVSLAPYLKVNAIAPGPMLFKKGQNPQVFKELVNESPLHREATLQELYDCIMFLVNNNSITGQTIYLDGGRHLI